MKAGQVSFSAGEISPLLQARVDLARYTTGLAELENMIVLPQGGVTRRGGFVNIGNAYSASSRLIPFEYNSTDSVMLEFGDKTARVWSGSSVKGSFSTPYAIGDVNDLRYVQSGNVIFLAHRKYKPQMLIRNTIASWSMKELEYSGGPYIDGAEWSSSASLVIWGSGATRTVQSSGATIFTSGLVGSLLQVEYAVEGKSETFQSEPFPHTGSSETYEVKGTMNVRTSGDWNGIIEVSRSTDGGSTWITVRQYNRTNYETQGQWDFTLSEAEEYVLYRVTAQHIPMNGEDTDISKWPVWAASTDTEGQASKTAATITVSISGFLKKETYKIQSVNPSVKQATVKLQGKSDASTDNTRYDVSFWAMGAWGEVQGYPGAVAMYQDRLIFAGSPLQPQTLWMSRTGDYADFSVSDPLSDDDAVTITLAGTRADRIHSLIASTDLLAFTTGGEWRIRGYGDSGAITPTAIVAHEQTTIGTKELQPLQINGRIILVQAQGRKVYALGYDLNTDGYSGSELSILSGHIFEGRTITGLTYQQTPNSLLWFVCSDGVCAVCTYNPEHEVIGWSRHSVLGGVKEIAAVKDNIYAAVHSGGSILMMRQAEGMYHDNGRDYVSMLRTLRLNVNGEGYTSRKLIARVIVSALRSSEAWIAPGDYDDEHNWERRRKLSFKGMSYIEDENIQMDNGFSPYAAVQIRSSGNEALTVAAITPELTAGG